MLLKSTSRLGLSLFVVAAIASGCGKTSSKLTDPTGSNGSGGSNGTAADQAAVSSALASTPELVEDDFSESADPTTVSADGSSGTQAGAGANATISAAELLHPLHYWRRIDSIRRTFTFTFSDSDSTGRPTRALVTIRKVLRGSFNILNDDAPNDSLPPDTSTTEVLHKRLADLWERHVLLRRVRSRWDSTATEWKVAAVSGVKITSFHGEDGTPVFGDTRVVKLRIQSASGDATINDPLSPRLLRELPGFNPGEDVTLTATTLRNDDVVVLVRGGDRRRFHNNGDNTYTLFWHTLPESGLHHIGVNALSNGTLFDRDSPYDSQLWAFPYLVRPEQMTELMP